MNILLLTPQRPFPPQQGTSLRNFNIIRGLAGRHRISLLTFLEPDQPPDPGPLAELCAEMVTVPAPSRSVAQRLRTLLTSRRPDMADRLASPPLAAALVRLLAERPFAIVQIEGIELAPLIPLVRAASPASRILFDNHNAETELQRRAFLTDLAQPRRWPAAAYSWVQTNRLRRFERWACRAADGVTAVSESDRRHLQALAPDVAVTVIPNCIDVTEYETAVPPDPPPDGPFDLLFTGKMDYRPNVDAVLWFADAVWPQIRAARPGATWAVVGQRPHARLERLRRLPGVTVTGQVPAVRPYLASAGVVVLPFRMGSGTRLKLIEALAAGRPVVSTPIGAEGSAIQPGRELLLATTAEEMAAACLALLADPAARRRLGEAGRALARQYDWRVVIPRFDDVYRQLSALPEVRGDR